VDVDARGVDSSNGASMVDVVAGEDRSNEVQTQQTAQPSETPSWSKLKSPARALSLRRMSCGAGVDGEARGEDASNGASMVDEGAGEDRSNEVQTQQMAQPSSTASFRKLRSSVLGLSLRRTSSVVPSVVGEAGEDRSDEVQTQQTAETPSWSKLKSPARALSLRRMSCGNSFVVPSVDGEAGEDGFGATTAQSDAFPQDDFSVIPEEAKELVSPKLPLNLAAQSAYIDAIPDDDDDDEDEHEIALEDILQAKLDQAEQRLSELERENRVMASHKRSLESSIAGDHDRQMVRLQLSDVQLQSRTTNSESINPQPVNRQDAAQVPPAARSRASSPEPWANQEAPAKKTFVTTRLRPSDALLSALAKAEQTDDFKLNVPCLSPMPQQQSICRARTDQAALDDSSSRSSTRTRIVHERLRMPDSAHSSLASRMSVPPSRVAPTSLDTSQPVRRHCARLQMPASMATDPRQTSASISVAPVTVPPQHFQSTRLQMPQRHAPVFPAMTNGNPPPLEATSEPAAPSPSPHTHLKL